MAAETHEANSPFSVYPDRIPALPVASQGQQLVPGRRCQDVQFRRGMQLQQLAQRNSLEGPEPPRMLILKELLGFLRRKALNHTSNIPRVAFHVNGCISRVHRSL